jgi:nucleoid-associated protein YgaU
VEEGDHLTPMTDRLYNDPRYYLQVAQANGLKNFRRLRAGTELIFPPIRERTS